jgi:hypothetical protein
MPAHANLVSVICVHSQSVYTIFLLNTMKPVFKVCLESSGFKHQTEENLKGKFNTYTIGHGSFKFNVN